ncbi:MAG: LEPR-XLL domain-containing protein, partial [Candidatus Cloacimonetes bacterium]|nr:LEPR-XLL domain-containing protein [Candidatus Cloacimonadota bacterium]
MNDLLKNLMNTRTYRWARRFINNLPSRGRKKSAKRAGLENFKLDRLEERILLSADPVTEIVYDTLDQKSPVELVQTPQKQLNQPIINALVLDMKNLEANQAGMDSVLSVSTDTVLGGSGDLNLEVINSGVVAPGYSPGVQNVASYTQNPGGTLEIEIAGYGAAGAVDGFDQINVSGSASLGGTLSVSLLDGFKPKVGDTFDIMTYGSVSGNFDAATGIFGFESDYYFDIVQKADRLQLVVKEVFAGDAFELVSSNLASFDDIGSFLIQDYLSVPTSVTFSGSIDLGSAFSISGEFTLGMEPTLDSVTLADESVVGVDVFTLIGRDVTATMGGSFGLSFTGMDFGLAVFDATDDDRSWISATGSIDSVALFNLPDLSISAENFELDVFWALGPENDSVIDFSSAPLTLADGGGTIAVLDQDGSLGNRISAGGDVSLSLPGVTVEGELAFSSNSDGVFVLGSSVDAGFSAFGLEAGVRDATFGIMLLDSGVVAEGSGSLHLSGGGFTLPAGDSVSFKYNNSNEEKSDQVIIIGSRSFTFSDMP